MNRDAWSDFFSPDTNSDTWALGNGQWWNVTKYIYSSTVVKYNFDILYLYFIWVFPYNATLYFYSTTIQRILLYFFLHFIHLTVLVFSYFLH